MIRSSEAALLTTETRDLHRISGMMIPAEKEYGVPDADDPVIFADIDPCSSLPMDPKRTGCFRKEFRTPKAYEVAVWATGADRH
jgi:hypothetical protein